jgi:hypothetical protein
MVTGEANTALHLSIMLGWVKMNNKPINFGTYLTHLAM